MNEVPAPGHEIVMALLDPIPDFQRWFSDQIGATDYGDQFALTGRNPVLRIDESAGAVLLTVGFEARWETVDVPSTVNDVEYRLSLEVAAGGFRVSYFMGARLQVAIGDHPPGNHVLRDERSAVLSFDEALAQMKVQMEAFLYHRDLLLDPRGVVDRPGPVDPVTLVTAPVGSAEQVVAGLLSTLERSRRDIDRRATTLRAGSGFAGETVPASRLDVWRDDQPLRIQANITVRVLPSDQAWWNDLDFFVILEVTPKGFCVEVIVGADLTQPMGALPAGDHLFYEYRSEVLDFDAAMAEIENRTAAVIALDTYCTALGLEPRP